MFNKNILTMSIYTFDNTARVIIFNEYEYRLKINKKKKNKYELMGMFI